MDLTPAMVQAAKACGEHEPEFYIVECARRDQALTVAEYFNFDKRGVEEIKILFPNEFPVKIGIYSEGSQCILADGYDNKLSMHTDIIDFKNWIVIRGEDNTDVIDLYKKLGMEINHGS